MKLNASTSAIITGEDYNYKKPKKTLKNLFMPNFRFQILFQKSINLYRNKNNNYNNLNRSFIINNITKCNHLNKSCITSQQIITKKILPDPKQKNYNKNLYLKRVSSETNFHKFYLNIKNIKNNKENKDNLNLPYFNLIKRNKVLNANKSPLSMNANQKYKNIKIKKMRLQRNYLMNSKNTNDYIIDNSLNKRKDKSYNKQINRFKLIKKKSKKGLEIKYYKWFI